MARISKEILEKIAKEEIRPVGKWSFVLKNSFLWSLFVLNILFGSVGFALSIYLFESSDVLNLVLSVNDFVEVLILAIPTIWVILTILFVVVGYLNFRYTDRGYKISFVKLLLINISIIILLGLGIHSLGVPRYVNRLLADRIPSYSELTDPRYKVWSRPEEGYLSGTISSIEENDILIIEGFDNNVWSIDISLAEVRRAVSLVKGEKIKVRGNTVEDGLFRASEILPWEGRGRKMQEIYH
jgi:hypothetical protein